MKAWWVSVGDEWGDFVHAETRSKAKSMFWNKWSWEADEWIYLRALREPKLDNKPLTAKNIQTAIGGDGLYESYTCNCELCK